MTEVEDVDLMGKQSEQQAEDLLAQGICVTEDFRHNWKTI
jgi:hypothetical protein